MSMDASETLERSVLESKDREQLLAIASALGAKAGSRTKKADIIDKILEQTGGGAAASNGKAPAEPRTSDGPRTSGGPRTSDGSRGDAPPVVVVPTPALVDEPRAEWELELEPSPVDDGDDAGSLAAGWRLERPPFPLETNLPGLFAAGDVRHGSTKRCATAVGEGAMAVALVHRHLADDLGA